jgi:hypothetical protein
VAATLADGGSVGVSGGGGVFAVVERVGLPTV